MRRALDQAQEAFLEAIRRGVTESTAEMQGQAALKAPVREGVLRASGSFFVDDVFKGDTSSAAAGRAIGGVFVVSLSRRSFKQGTPNRQSTVETAKRPGFIRGVVGFNTRYAAVQHEQKFRHPKGGTDKYLEKALKKVLPQVPRVLRKKAKEAGF